jgi:hypothetical protein
MADTQIEMVDIVNENDEVTGQADKRKAHAEGLLHRTVISEVKNGKGEWLLVKQAGDRQDAGQYVSPSADTFVRANRLRMRSGAKQWRKWG